MVIEINLNPIGNEFVKISQLDLTIVYNIIR